MAREDKENDDSYVDFDVYWTEIAVLKLYESIVEVLENYIKRINIRYTVALITVMFPFGENLQFSVADTVLALFKCYTVKRTEILCRTLCCLSVAVLVHNMEDITMACNASMCYCATSAAEGLFSSDGRE